MPIDRRAPLILTALLACTSAVSGEPAATKGTRVADDGGAKPDTTKPDTTKPDTTKPDTDPAATAIKVAVGSVQLQDDCPDPEGATPASSLPASPAKRMPPGVAVARRACQQSTLQLTFDNASAAPAQVRIVEVRLRDVDTDTVVATIASRLPSAWSQADNAYTAWDQRIAAGASVRTSYAVTPPSWFEIDAKLGTDSHNRTFDVQVVLEADGTSITARSAAFIRPPEMVMPPT